MTTPHVQPITNPALAGGGLSPLTTMSIPRPLPSPIRYQGGKALASQIYPCPKVVVD